MFFVAFAIAIALGVALLIGADAGQVFGLGKEQTAQALPLVVILVVLAAALFTRRQKLGEIAGNLAVWVAIFALVLVGYAYRDNLQDAAARVFGELVPGAAVVDAQKGTATFRRGRGGHFEVNATINGATMPLLFDTGASAVVLSSEDARAAGFDLRRLSYSVMVSTANGKGRAAPVVLERIEVGGIVRERIRAYIAEPGALDMSLLGMTFLETLDRYTVTANSLELAG